MKKTLLITAFAITLFSFSFDTKVIEFNYPKRSDAKFTMTSDKFKKFTKEWRGEDYYYICEKGADGIICSVLFYKLNDDEKKMLVAEPKALLNLPDKSPGYPLTYFTTNSNLKAFESNNQQWGEATGEFMFSHADVKEMAGMKVNQKNMNAYAMFGDDLFVNIHLSKVACTKADSIAMKEILDSLKK